MGVITDFFAAPRGDIEDIAPGDDLADKYPFLPAKGVDPVKLATLEALVTGQDLGQTDAVLDLIQRPVKQLDGGHFLLLPVSAQLIDKGAGWSENDIAQLAKRWSRTEELQADRWSTDRTRAFLADLRALFQRAKQQDRPVFQRIVV